MRERWGRTQVLLSWLVWSQMWCASSLQGKEASRARGAGTNTLLGDLWESWSAILQLWKEECSFTWWISYDYVLPWPRLLLRTSFLGHNVKKCYTLLAPHSSKRDICGRGVLVLPQSLTSFSLPHYIRASQDSRAMHAPKWSNGSLLRFTGI